jgi:hypothetical protein
MIIGDVCELVHQAADRLDTSKMGEMSPITMLCKTQNPAKLGWITTGSMMQSTSNDLEKESVGCQPPHLLW